MTATTPVLDVPSLDQPFSAESLSAFAQVLPGYMTSQRWYRAKARTIAQVSVLDVLPLTAMQSHVLLVQVEYTDGENDEYFIAFSLAKDESGIAPADLAIRLKSKDGQTGILYNGLSNAALRSAFLDAVACNAVFPGQAGSLHAEHTGPLDRDCNSSEELSSSVSRAEQSNSSVIFGDKYIFKIFRKLETGINPDIEIGKFLTKQQFKHTPAVLGQLEYRTPHGDQMYAGILQAFVRNEGDAWKYTLESLTPFLGRALSKGDAPALPSQHPLELADHPVPAVAQELIGSYLPAASLLGKRTAQMHAALTADATDPDFAPEPFTSEYASILLDDMRKEADRVFGLLKNNTGKLHGEAKAGAEKLLASEPQVRGRFADLAQRPVKAVRIRHHGDYHLGQVLWTGSDFVIIDFEGEPARPLAARRVKTLAMRDVAGMIRSFSYAGFAALFGQVSGVPNSGDSKKTVESWAAFWSGWVSAAYLRAYIDELGSTPSASTDPAERRTLFDAFVLQKAMYEVSYELNNRPDWLPIPLRGILSLLG